MAVQGFVCGGELPDDREHNGGEGRNVMQALIISFDSLATNSLGCYGNEWIETPHCDRLAATGAIFDQHFVETTSDRSGMSWLGKGQATGSAPKTSVQLGDLLKSDKIHSRLVTSGPQQSWQQAIPFDEVQRVQGEEGADAKPDKIPFAEVVQAGISVWNDAAFQEKPRLLWLHSAVPEVPPAGFESLYFDDFEDRGQEIAQLSQDERSRHPALYAGAVSLIDHWLGSLLEGVEPGFQETPTLVIVMAAKGYLWQQPKPSKSDDSRGHSDVLGDQLTRTALILKTYGQARFKDLVCLRSNRLVQASDFVPTLVDWFHPASALPQESSSWLRELTEENPPRPILTYNDGGTREAVRTQEWLLIRDTGEKQEVESTEPTRRVSLYVKPEDIWDVNNIASQQPEIVADLIGKISSSH